MRKGVSKLSARGCLAEGEWSDKRDEIIAAFAEFRKKHPDRTFASGRKFFVWYKGRSYPPKEIRSLVERRPTSTFSGGRTTNEMFWNLGLNIDRKHLLKEYKSLVQGPECERCLMELDDRIEELFTQQWAELNKGRLGAISGRPGIYLLAYSRRTLRGTRVKPQDVFYVGMSTTALKVRLRQFWDGLNDCDHHSAAKRFYQDWCGGRPFSDIETENRFYVATLPIECRPQKGLRSADDLEKLGTVVALEYLALARIKRQCDLEPPLNKK
jgi:hypothetical protein